MLTILTDYFKTLFWLAAIAGVTAATMSAAILLLKVDFVALLFG